MKTNFRIILLCIFLLGFHQSNFSQKNKSVRIDQVPKSFTIENSELEKLFSLKLNQTVSSKTNKYLNNAIVLLNSSYKDNKQLKLKLNYIKNAELFVQINGKDSKVIYILSSDDSVFYNSTYDQTKVTLTQCKKDDILSE